MLDQEADFDDLGELDLPAAGGKESSGPAAVPAAAAKPAAAKASDEQELADLM